MKSFDLGKSKEEQRFRSLFVRNVFTDYLEIDPNNNRELLGFNEGNTINNDDNKSVAINANNGNITNVNAVYLSGVLTKKSGSNGNTNDANINTINFTGRSTKEPPFGTIYADNKSFYFVKDRPQGTKPALSVNDTSADNNICMAKLDEDYLTLRSGIKTYGDVFIGTDDHRKTTTINGTLNVSGDTTIGGTLSVAGVITNTDLTNRLNAKADKANHTNNTNTFTKITYNSQGIITGGADLVADDIPTLEISKINGLQTKLDNKADKSDTYTKSETDTKLYGKADKSNTYTKSETDIKLDNKSNEGHTHTYETINTIYGIIDNRIKEMFEYYYANDINTCYKLFEVIDVSLSTRGSTLTLNKIWAPRLI